MLINFYIPGIIVLWRWRGILNKKKRHLIGRFKENFGIFENSINYLLFLKEQKQKNKKKQEKCISFLLLKFLFKILNLTKKNITSEQKFWFFFLLNYFFFLFIL